jgi:hypothetical protein
MTFIPILTPGREDNLGPMQVPHDIYEFVTTDPNWVNEIETRAATTRQAYLNSIRYWMEENGSCVVRSASSGKFKVIQGINACNTILYGDEIIDGMEGGGNEGPPGPPPGPITRFSISANPEAGGYPVTTTLTIDPGTDTWIDAFEINWGDGNTQIIAVDDLVPLEHTYPIVGDYEISVQPLDSSGNDYWHTETILITAREEE